MEESSSARKILGAERHSESPGFRGTSATGLRQFSGPNNRLVTANPQFEKDASRAALRALARASQLDRSP